MELEMEITMDRLFAMINGMISLINVALLVVTVRKYKEWFNLPSVQLKKQAGQRKRSAETKKPSTESSVKQKDFGSGNVLMSKLTEERLLRNFEKIDKQFFLKKNISVNDLADFLDTNQRYVSHMLKKHLGMDFTTYVQQCRINYLIQLVERDPRLSRVKLSVLADNVGFTNVNNFIRAFTAVKGMPPEDYFRQVWSR